MVDEFYIAYCPLMQQINVDICFRENFSFQKKKKLIKLKKYPTI